MTDSYTRILAPLDGSHVGAQALDHAVAIAAQSHAMLTLLQVIPDIGTIVGEPITPMIGSTTYEKADTSVDVTSMQAAWIDEARATLQETGDRLSAQGVKVNSAVIQGLPADAILAYAKAEKVDLIVMSTHGRGGVARLIYGSVATQVMRAAPCPVLVVRAQPEEN